MLTAMQFPGEMARNSNARRHHSCFADREEAYQNLAQPLAGERGRRPCRSSSGERPFQIRQLCVFAIRKECKQPKGDKDAEQYDTVSGRISTNAVAIYVRPMIPMMCACRLGASVCASVSLLHPPYCPRPIKPGRRAPTNPVRGSCAANVLLHVFSFFLSLFPCFRR